MELKYLLRSRLKARVGHKFTAAGEEYALQGKLGDGAIGVVRKARRLKNNEIVAVKFLAPEEKYIELSSLEDIRARFRREGLRGVSLDHDNLVKVIAYEDNEDGSSFHGKKPPLNPFIIMEHVRGRTLENHIHKYALEEPTLNVTIPSITIAARIADALVYLHEKRLVHRDVKPANIYLTAIAEKNVPSIVKLGDFGVVKWGDFKASISTGVLTVSGHQGLGTLKYMSPEQAVKPKDVGVRSDIYSFGITLFELLTCQILSTPHHVFDLTRQRMQRTGNPMSWLYELGFGLIPHHVEILLHSVYDSLMLSPKSRPSSRQFRVQLNELVHTLERLKGI